MSSMPSARFGACFVPASVIVTKGTCHESDAAKPDEVCEVRRRWEDGHTSKAPDARRTCPVADPQEFRKLTRAELDELAGEALPERAAMSLINANVAAPVNLAAALNVLSDN